MSQVFVPPLQPIYGDASEAVRHTSLQPPQRAYPHTTSQAGYLLPDVGQAAGSITPAYRLAQHAVSNLVQPTHPSTSGSPSDFHGQESCAYTGAVDTPYRVTSEFMQNPSSRLICTTMIQPIPKVTQQFPITAIQHSDQNRQVGGISIFSRHNMRSDLTDYSHLGEAASMINNVRVQRSGLQNFVTNNTSVNYLVRPEIPRLPTDLLKEIDNKFNQHSHTLNTASNLGPSWMI